MGKKKTVREKIESMEDQIVEIPPRLIGRYGAGMMLIPSAREIMELMSKIPAGKVLTVGQIRDYLARKYQVVTTCPLVTGIAIRLIAEAVESGEIEKVPWWRVIKSDGSLNPKLPGGGKVQKKRLEDEGLVVVQKGKKLKVQDFRQHLMEL